jgi:FMN-dependent NADH-azoreductase
MEHHLRYLSDFIQGHYSVPAPATIVAELSNARVDPALARFRTAHELSLAGALEAVRRTVHEVAGAEVAR